MKALIRVGVAFAALGVSVYAQDRTVTSTTVKGDDVKTVLMRGCLTQRPPSGVFMLSGAITATGNDLKSKTRAKTDVDGNNTTVKEKTETKLDDRDHHPAVPAIYVLSPRTGVDLSRFVGHEVEIAAVTPSKRDDDAKVKINEETTAHVEDAPDVKTKTETKAELPAGTSQLIVVSARQISPACVSR